MKTYSPKPRDIERRWYVLDASGAILGRLATQAASILRGKHKPIFAPHADTGDHVIVINAKEVTLSGGKENKKIAYPHSGYPGGLTETVYSQPPSVVTPWTDITFDPMPSIAAPILLSMRATSWTCG